MTSLPQLSPTRYSITGPDTHRLTEVVLQQHPADPRIQIWVLARSEQQQVFHHASGTWRDETHAFTGWRRHQDLVAQWTAEWGFETAEAAAAAYQAYRERRASDPHRFGPIEADGKTRLHLMARSSDPAHGAGEIAEWARLGGPIDPQTQNLDTPLHYAVWQKAEAQAMALLAAGANPNIPNYRGQTPFHHALNTGQPEIIRAMHEAGANWGARDHDNKTPFMLLCQPKTTGVRRSAEVPEELCDVLSEIMPPERLEPHVCQALARLHGNAFSNRLAGRLLSRMEALLLDAIPMPAAKPGTRRRTRI